MIKKILKGLLFTTVLLSILAFTPPTANYTTDVYTVLLIHGDQADGTAGTDILDSETTPKTITAVNQAQVDTAQYKNLTGSTGSILFDGTGDYLSLVDSDDWNFGSGDFTIDFWTRFASVDSVQFLGKWDATAGTKNWNLTWYGNKLYFFISTDGSNEIGNYALGCSWTPSTNTWYHIAVVRSGNNLKTYIGGSQIGSTEDVTGVTIFSSTRILAISTNGMAPYYDYSINGWIDEVRISKGIARDWASATRRIMIISKGLWKNLLWDIKDMLSNIQTRLICDYSLS